jgi:hypothetical protein
MYGKKKKIPGVWTRSGGWKIIKPTTFFKRRIRTHALAVRSFFLLLLFRVVYLVGNAFPPARLFGKDMSNSLLKLDQARFTLEQLVRNLDETIGKLRACDEDTHRDVIIKCNSTVLRSRLALLQQPEFATSFGRTSAQLEA